MHVSRVVFLLLLLLASASYGQAATPMVPARPPLVRPVTNAPVFPTPSHTPSGTGLPGERVPSADGVQRSPNKRLLPVSNEPGLWAADEAQASAIDSHTHPLFNIRLPYPAFATDETTSEVMTMCVYSMSVAGDNAGRTADIKEFSPNVRKCMASRAVASCAEDWWRILLVRKNPPPEQEELARKTLAHAAALALLNCKDAGMTGDHADVLAEVVREFRKGVLQNLMAGRAIQ